MDSRELLIVLLLLTLAHCLEYDRKKTSLEEIAAKQATSVPQVYRRSLQFNESEINASTIGEASCSLCNGFPVLKDLVPPNYAIQSIPANVTCQDLNSLISTFPLDHSDWSDCLVYRGLYSGPCCQRPSPPYVCEQNIRSQLLQNYSASIMPLPDSGIFETTMLLEFHHITELSTKDGTVNVFVWFYLEWKDPRLAWNVSDEYCTPSITARASSDLQRTEIWVPDIDLLNQASGVQNFPDAMATIYHDGTVVWRRNGGLTAFCFFTGLNRFPFDTLGCSFLIGAWTRDVNVNITLGGDGGQGWVAGEALARIIYNEYSLKVDQITSGFRSPPPLKSIVYYNLYFERSSRYYVLKILLPTIVFTILSFGVFLLDLRVGERLSYGLTVLLVIIAQDISTSTLLPITDKRLWVNTFVVASFYWVLITNLESVFVAWLYFVGDEHDEKAILEAEKKRSGNADSNGEARDLRHVKDSILAKAVPSTSLQQDDEEQAGSYGGAPHSLEDEISASPEHKNVAFCDDTKDEPGDAKVSDSAPDRRAVFSRMKKVKGSRGLMSIQQLVLQKAKMRHRTIKKIDKWFFWVLSCTYVLFVVLMFATNSLWDDGNPLFVEVTN